MVLYEISSGYKRPAKSAYPIHFCPKKKYIRYIPLSKIHNPTTQSVQLLRIVLIPLRELSLSVLGLLTVLVLCPNLGVVGRVVRWVMRGVWDARVEFAQRLVSMVLL